MKTGLWQSLKKFFKKPTPSKKTTFQWPDYDYEILKFRQDAEDRKLERCARETAFDMLQQLIRGGKGSIIIQKPVAMYITECYPLKSKYNSDSYNELINTEFKKLKKQHKILWESL